MLGGKTSDIVPRRYNFSATGGASGRNSVADRYNPCTRA
jgi:hypothetical protein